MAIEKEIPAYRLEDLTFTVTLRDKDGNVIDFSSGYANIVIFIYNADGSVFEKYSRATTAGWKAIDTTNQNVGKLSFATDSATTKLGVLGKKYVEVLTRKTDAGLADNAYDTIERAYLFTLKESISSTITLP
jgi:hypothetical protein